MDVLKELSSWLTETYSSSLKLDGIILLHRVDDVRMRDWAKRNIEVFKRLCGSDALNVILCTTMWDRVTAEEGSQLESELVSTSKFWGWMKSQGSKVCRYDGDRATALGLVEHFVRKKSQVELELPHQMVEDREGLNETSAALVPEVELIKRKYRDKMMQLSKDTDELKGSIQSLHEAKYAEMLGKLEAQQKAHKEELERLAGESRRREAELAAENSRLASELRYLRLSPAGLPPTYGVEETHSADPPPYESLQPSTSRPNEIYLSCKIPV